MLQFWNRLTRWCCYRNVQISNLNWSGALFRRARSNTAQCAWIDQKKNCADTYTTPLRSMFCGKFFWILYNHQDAAEQVRTPPHILSHDFLAVMLSGLLKTTSYIRLCFQIRSLENLNVEHIMFQTIIDITSSVLHFSLFPLFRSLLLRFSLMCQDVDGHIVESPSFKHSCSKGIKVWRKAPNRSRLRELPTISGQVSQDRKGHIYDLRRYELPLPIWDKVITQASNTTNAISPLKFK